MEPPTAKRGMRGGRWVLVVAANFAVEILQQGFLKSMGVLLPSLVDYFDTDYATMGTIVSVEFCTCYIATPLWLFLSKKINPRVLATLGGLAAGLSVICASFVETTFMLGLLFFLTGLFAAAVIQRGSIALREHCGEKFASMKTFTLMGAFVGGMSMPALTTKVYRTWGLRASILLFGGLLLHFVPIGLIFKKPRTKRMHGTEEMTDLREDESAQSSSSGKFEITETAPCLQDTETMDGPMVDGTGSARRHKDRTLLPQMSFLRMLGALSQALDVPALCEEWLVATMLLPSKFLADITYVGWFMFQVSMALSAGVDPDLVAYLPVVTGLGGVVMRSLCTATLLYLPRRGLVLMATCEVIAIVGLVLYPLGNNFYHFFALSFISGFGIAGTFPAYYAVLCPVISEKNFPAMMTYSLCSCGLGGLTAGLLLGKIVDVTGSFAFVFWVQAGMMGASLMLLLSFGCVTWRKTRDRKSTKPNNI